MIPELRSLLADELRGLGLQASPYQLGNPTPPCIQILTGPTDYDVANARGVDRYTLRVQGVVSLATTDENAQRILDEWCEPSGEKSVKQCLERADLSAIGCDVRVVGHGGQVVFVPEGKGPMLGAEWTVEVLVNGGF